MGVASRCRAAYFVHNRIDDSENAMIAGLIDSSLILRLKYNVGRLNCMANVACIRLPFCCGVQLSRIRGKDDFSLFIENSDSFHPWFFADGADDVLGIFFAVHEHGITHRPLDDIAGGVGIAASIFHEITGVCGYGVVGVETETYSQNEEQYNKQAKAERLCELF